MGTYVVPAGVEESRDYDSGSYDSWWDHSDLSGTLSGLPFQRPLSDSQWMLRAMSKQFKLNERKTFELMEEEFDPARQNDYELADLKIRATRVFDKVYQFFVFSQDFNAEPILNAAIRLENVCRMFSRILNLEFVEGSIVRGNPLRQPQSSFRSPFRDRFNPFHRDPIRTADRVPLSLRRSHSGGNLNPSPANEGRNERANAVGRLNRTYSANNLNRTYNAGPANVPAINVLNATPTVYVTARDATPSIDERLLRITQDLNHTIDRMAGNSTSANYTGEPSYDASSYYLEGPKSQLRTSFMQYQPRAVIPVTKRAQQGLHATL